MTATDLPPILRHLPPAPDEEALLDGFTAYTVADGHRDVPGAGGGRASS